MTLKSTYIKSLGKLSGRVARLLDLSWLKPSEKSSARITLIICLVIFLLATGVRVMHWQDVLPLIENGKMYFGMTDLYRADAQNLLSGRLDLFVRGPAPPSDADIITHPPGYPLMLALLFKIFGESDSVWRYAHLLLDALAAVLIFLIAAELLPRGVAILAGVLVAISPQVAYTSLMLLPDSPSIVPILLAVLLLVRAFKRPRLLTIIGAGLLIGVSCWFRPNALLLSPFLALFVLLLFERGRRWRYALALVAATILVLLPITIRNILVFRSFIPLSLGAGHNICAGIADYDPENRFGLINKDHLVNQWEAQIYNRPDYARSLFAPDGIARERERIKRCVPVIKSNPYWFTKVMLRRVGFMLTLERTYIIAPAPAVTHSLADARGKIPAWASSPDELIAQTTIVSPETELRLSDDGQALLFTGDDSNESQQFISPKIAIEPGTDYVLQIPLDSIKGRFVVAVKNGKRKLLASAAIPDAFQGLPPDKPTNLLQIPFVSGGEREVFIVISNGGSQPLRPAASIGRVELFALGKTSYGWLKLPRLALRLAQKYFTTQWMLPLIFIGMAFMLLAGRWRALLLLLAVPLYYLSAQAPLHTEYRYVIAIHYFLFILAAVTLYWLGIKLWQGVRKFPAKAQRREENRE
jgi:hypothetical protein